MSFAWLVLLLSLLTICACQKPNIIIFYCDDLGWNDVSYHGAKEVPTPNIDSLAKDSVVLSNYYAQPLCTPSRGSLLTGKYPIHLGLQHLVVPAGGPWGLPKHHKLMPEIFNEMGYESHGVGKWHLGFSDLGYLPTYRGFKSFFGFWTGVENYFTHFADSPPYSGLDLHDDLELARNYSGVYGPDLYTQKAIQIIRNHDQNKPLFLYVSQQAVHSGNFENDPLQAPDEYVNLFPHIQNPTRKKFAGVIHALDKSFGEIFTSLRENDMLHNTIIVLASDNGGSVQGQEGTAGSNFPFKGGKFTLWEGGIKVAAYIWSTELRQRKRIATHLMHVSDWLPTLYAAAGGNPATLPPMDGFNMWPTIVDNEPSPRDTVLLNIDPVWHMAAIKKGNFKFLRGTYRKGAFDNWYDKRGIKMRDDVDERDVLNRESPEFYHQLLLEYHRRRRACPVAQILNQTFGVPLIEDEYYQKWRNELTVKCGRKRHSDAPCYPTSAACLFDLSQDRCEYNNVADQYPEVVNELRNLIDEYRQEMTPIRNTASDPNANPKYHCDAWVPWRSPRYYNGC